MAASPTGCRRGRQRASLHTAGQSAGGILVPPDPAAFRRRLNRGAGFWGRRWASFASRPVRCRQLTARYVVPAIAGTAWCRLVRCRQSAARFRPATEKRGTAGPDGALRGRWGVPRSRAVDRLHCSQPAGRRMRTLQFSRLELIRTWTNRTGSTQRWPPDLSPAAGVRAHGGYPSIITPANPEVI